MTCVTRTVLSALVSWVLCVVAPAALDAQQQGATGAQSPDSLAMPQDTVIPPRLTNMREVSRTLDEAYPISLQRRGIGGVARMRLFINEEGAPDTVSLRASTGLTSLDAAAHRTARQARFRPATIGGQPTGAWVDFNVRFEGKDHARSSPSVISVPERSTLKSSLHAFYPPDLKGAQIGTSVGLSLIVDAAGSVIDHDIVDPSCFDAANQAAAELTRSMPFEPDSTTSGRWTFATVTFNTDSVRLKLFGDTMARDTTSKAPRDPDRPRPVSRAPRLNNRPTVSRALVSRYPRLLRDKGIGGSAVVHFQVREDGRVAYKTVSASSGYCELDMAAIEVARVMRFDPATIDDKPLMVWVEIPINFSAR
ncbi:MAG TPA: TonB family protein [Longimicrobiales bacterium]|nr:TonB family protein [Longimicrobiales bacterium]